MSTKARLIQVSIVKAPLGGDALPASIAGPSLGRGPGLTTDGPNLPFWVQPRVEFIEPSWWPLASRTVRPVPSSMS